MLLPLALRSRKACFVLSCLGAVLLSTSLLLAQENTSKSAKKSKTLLADDTFDLFDTLLDMSIGLISEEEFKSQLEKNRVKNFKEAFKNRLEELENDRLGIREVDAESFTKLVKSMKTVSSAKHVRPIGVSNDLTICPQNSPYSWHVRAPNSPAFVLAR